MYERYSQLVLSLLKVPPPPRDPFGDEKSLRIFRASPNYLRYRLYTWVIRLSFAFIVMLGFAAFEGVFLANAMEHGGNVLWMFMIVLNVIVITGFVVHAAISYITLRLDYEMRWYKVTDRSLLIREGVMRVREMTMTFANIQNISVSQGPIQRYFDIADLRVETAGGGGMMVEQQKGHGGYNMHEGVLRGVDNAEEIRVLMLERLRRQQDSGLGDHDDGSSLANSGGAAVATVSAEMISALQGLRDEAVSFRIAAHAQ